MPTWAMISVVVGWIVGWSGIGAWRMVTRDARPRRSSVSGVVTRGSRVGCGCGAPWFCRGSRRWWCRRGSGQESSPVGGDDLMMEQRRQTRSLCWSCRRSSCAGGGPSTPRRAGGSGRPTGSAGRAGDGVADGAGRCGRTRCPAAVRPAQPGAERWRRRKLASPPGPESRSTALPMMASSSAVQPGGPSRRAFPDIDADRADEDVGSWVVAGAVPDEKADEVPAAPAEVSIPVMPENSSMLAGVSEPPRGREARARCPAQWPEPCWSTPPAGGAPPGRWIGQRDVLPRPSAPARRLRHQARR